MLKYSRHSATPNSHTYHSSGAPLIDAGVAEPKAFAAANESFALIVLALQEALD
jgi:hypothetical protein